ncbi:MAG: AraC family transcriptional regulator [Eubacterium sp.]
MEKQEKVLAVQRMQDYIDAHILETITLKEIANYAGYSPFYCSRIFKDLTGKSPFEYIRLLRLSQAALKLRDEKVKVVDVALDFVFDSHEGFTRSFSKAFGVTPHKYSKNPPPIKLFMPSPIKDWYLTMKEGEARMKIYEKEVETVFVQVIERPERKLILKSGQEAEEYFGYCEEVGCDVWGVLCSIKEALYEPIGVWLPKKLRPEGTSRYAQGVEVSADYNGEIPQGYAVIDLPPCKMMVFQGEPFEDEKFYKAVKDLEQVIENYKPELYGFEWADKDAPRFQMEPQGYRGYIEARPVRALGK